MNINLILLIITFLSLSAATFYVNDIETMGESIRTIGEALRLGSQFQDINNNKINLGRHQNILNGYHPSILPLTIQPYYPNKIKYYQLMFHIHLSIIKKSPTTVSCHQKSFLSNDYQNKESIYPYSNINFVHN